jgi:CRP/FNR family transcriptional regulator, cyclic AMP receptor protein
MWQSVCIGLHWFVQVAHRHSPGERFRQPCLADQQEFAMGVPQRFAILNDCLRCTLRRSCDFCSLPQPLMNEFNAMGHLTLYSGNATLMTEGQIPRGVYTVCSGRAKLSVEARDGKTIILRIAGNRHVLGLSAVVSGAASLITVTTIERCQIKFVERDRFLSLIERNSHAALECAAMLAHKVTT